MQHTPMCIVPCHDFASSRLAPRPLNPGQQLRAMIAISECDVLRKSPKSPTSVHSRVLPFSGN